MKTTPLDIQQQQFRRSLRGYDPHEVHTFLDLVAGEFEQLVKETNQLKEDGRRHQALLEEYRERERTVKDTMIMAQRVMEEIETNARKEAEIIIAQAGVDAQRMLDAAQSRLDSLVGDIREVKALRARVLAELRGTLETHRKVLEVTEAGTDGQSGIEDTLAFVPHKARGQG
jgi:cell division initiation protein